MLRRRHAHDACAKTPWQPRLRKSGVREASYMSSCNLAGLSGIGVARVGGRSRKAGGCVVKRTDFVEALISHPSLCEQTLQAGIKDTSKNLRQFSP